MNASGHRCAHGTWRLAHRVVNDRGPMHLQCKQLLAPCMPGAHMHTNIAGTTLLPPTCLNVVRRASGVEMSTPARRSHTRTWPELSPVTTWEQSRSVQIEVTISNRPCSTSWYSSAVNSSHLGTDCAELLARGVVTHVLNCPCQASPSPSCVAQPARTHNQSRGCGVV